MDAVWFGLEVVSRWLHVGTAVVLVGGSVFVRYVLMPAAAPLPDDQHEALRERIMGTWRKFVWIGIALLLVTGFFNFFRLLPRHEGDRLWHMLIGIKILLAMGVFFLASALAGRSAAFEGLRRNNRTWLATTILLAAVVIAISGYAKVALPPQPAVPADGP